LSTTTSAPPRAPRPRWRQCRTRGARVGRRLEPHEPCPVRQRRWSASGSPTLIWRTTQPPLIHAIEQPVRAPVHVLRNDDLVAGLQQRLQDGVLRREPGANAAACRTPSRSASTAPARHASGCSSRIIEPAMLSGFLLLVVEVWKIVQSRSRSPARMAARRECLVANSISSLLLRLTRLSQSRDPCRSV